MQHAEDDRTILAGKPLRRKSICRTFSDCTTAPRMGLVSGCYPLDDFYVKHPDNVPLKAAKAPKAAAATGAGTGASR